MAPHALVPHTACFCPFFSLGKGLNFHQEGKINVCQATHLPVGLLQPVPMPSSGILAGRVTARPRSASLSAHSHHQPTLVPPGTTFKPS